MNKTAIIYVRVSDPSQVDNFSLDTQENACKKKAGELGYEKLKLFREEGISAKTIEDRPQLQEALLYCKNKRNNVGIFVVYSFSRLSRRTIDFLTMKALLKSNGTSLISVVEPSGDDPENELISTIISSINQFDNEIKARVVRANMKARFLQGYPLGRPYLGYTMGVVDGKPCPVPQEPLFSLIRSMWYRVKSERLSLRGVQKELKKLGQKHYPVQTLSGVFTSQFYMGTIQSAKYGEIHGKHEPMIDQGTYYEVREILTGKQPHIPERHHLNEDFPLRGTLVCEYCSRHLSGSWSGGRRQKYPYYYCSSRGSHSIISYNSVTAKTRFLDLQSSFSANEKGMKLFTELLQEQYETRVKQQQYVETDVSIDIEKLTQMKKELGRKHLAGIYNDADYVDMRNDIDIQLAQKHSQMNQKNIQNVDIEKVTSFASKYFTDLGGAWDKATPEGKHKISCSMFPVGVVCTKEKLRTQQVERIYTLTKDYSEKILFSTPCRIRTGDSRAENPLS